MGPVEPHTEVADHERVDDRNGWAGCARELGPVAAVRGDELLDERALPYDHEAVERALRRWPRVRSCTPSAEDTRIERVRARHRLSNTQPSTRRRPFRVASMAEFTRAMD